MSNLIPIIEQLQDAKTHKERATWLKQCPFDILGRYDMTIRNRLMNAGFPAGLDYLDTVRVAKSAVRDPDTGCFSADSDDVLIAAAVELEEKAERADAARQKPEPDHSITDL